MTADATNQTQAQHHQKNSHVYQFQLAPNTLFAPFAILPLVTRKPKNSRDGLSLTQVIGSTLSAAFGVQSSKNRDRDFAQGHPLQFIAAGIIFTVLFVISIIALVRWVVG